MMWLRIFGVVSVLCAVFLLGMLLAAPELPYNPSGFPIGYRFVAVSLNGEPLALHRTTLEVRGRLTFHHRVGGYAPCNGWGGHVIFLPGKRTVWQEVAVTTAQCAEPVMELEQKYLRALRGTLHWRTDETSLILENGTDVLRFQLAPQS